MKILWTDGSASPNPGPGGWAVIEISSAGNIQGWTCPNNTTMPIGTVTALKDIRDNNTYAVAKLADGKCWMIENLRLGTNSGPILLNYATTNLPASRVFNLLASRDPIVNAWCSDSNSSSCVNQSLVASNNTTNTVSEMTTPLLAGDDNTGIYSMGNYYNWYTATAGSGTYSQASGKAAYSICPTGWRLPDTHSDTGDFKLLNTALGGYGSSTSKHWRVYPNNFIYSGRISSSGSAIEGHGSDADLLGSRAVGENAIVKFYISPSRNSPGGYVSLKSYGAAVRCMAGS